MKNSLDKKIELLAPAGDLERLKTAVVFGADAVYCGLPEWSLRNPREITFTLETLQEGIKFAHERGVKVYLTFNVFLHEEQVEETKKKLQEIKKKLKVKKTYPISAVTGEGVGELFNDVFETASKLPIPKFEEVEKVFTFKDIDERFFEVKKINSGFRVYCKRIDRLVERLDINNWEALARIKDIMKKLGIVKAMQKQGLKDGDLIWVGEKVIEW